MREWPDTELLLAYAPEPGQAMGLDDQEKDNEPAKHHMFDVRCRVHSQRYAEHMRNVGQKYRHQHHESSPEKAAYYGSQPANDDDEQQLQRSVQIEGERFPGTQMYIGP